MTDKWKAVFGLIMLLSIVGLAAVIAVGHVEEKTSYGLHDILTALFVLSGSFASWAFGSHSKSPDPPSGSSSGPPNE